MPANTINKGESLAQSYPKVNQAIIDSYDAKTKAERADRNSNEALVKAKNTTNQLKQIVIEGDSSVEAAQARVNAYGGSVETLTERIEYLETEINIKMPPFNATGTPDQDDSEAFQKALDIAKQTGGVKIKVPAGTYSIGSTLRLHRNTRIELDDDAVLQLTLITGPMFINGEKGNSTYATGYNGDGNIQFIGGTIDLYNNILTPTPVTEYGGQAFALAHAENIRIERVTIKNGQNTHYIEINSCKNVRIVNNQFLDEIVTGTALYEVIQIDMAIQQGFPLFGGYDLTPCDDIVIEGNTFENCHTAVGTHTSSYDANGKQVLHSNIRVINNKIKNCSFHGIRAESWTKAKISLNEFDTCSQNGVILVGASQCDLVDNNFSNIKDHGIYVTNKSGPITENSKNIKISINRFKDISRTGIRVNMTDGLTVIGNEGENIGEKGVHVSYTNYFTVKVNTFRGVSQAADGEHQGVFIGASSKGEVSDIQIDNSGYANRFSYALDIDSGSSEVNASFTKLVKGALGKVINRSSTSYVSSNPYEVMLTGIMDSVTSGEVTLNDDINNYKHLIIATGTVGTNNLRHEIARGYFNGGFRPGEDYINVNTSNGKLVARVVSERKINILSASDSLRYIVGVV